ncbi:hypothetical protein EV714DRAFT_240682 [Schizophyllum commune]
MLSYILLRLVHFVYFICLIFKSRWRHFRRRIPLPIQAPRDRLPKHLAVLLVVDPSAAEKLANDPRARERLEEAIIETVESTVKWCRMLGIPRLTIYDREGRVQEMSSEMQKRILSVHTLPEASSSEAEADYLLTPPLSEHDDSRPISPIEEITSGAVHITKFRIPEIQRPKPPTKGMKRRQRNGDQDKRTSQQLRDLPALEICIVDRRVSKAMLAETATELAVNARASAHEPSSTSLHLSIAELNTMIEGKYGLSEPDFMIVHPLTPPKSRAEPLELHGFPPWQIRLTEIYYDRYRVRRTIRDWGEARFIPLDENTFRSALDQFAGAQMRFGK